MDGESPDIPLAVIRRIDEEGVNPWRAFREWRGLTQGEAAEKAGSDQSSISALERGDRRLRRLRPKLAEVYGVAVADIEAWESARGKEAVGTPSY
ncbi:MAG: helix-turn-helix transcriptional regulator [Woeseia sp.]